MNNARPKRTQHRATYGLLLVALVSLCGLAIPSPECSGVDRTWQQNAGGSWVEPSHWIGGVVPGVGDRAILPQDSFNTYEVLYDGEYTANTALSSLLISGFFNIGVSRPTTLRQDQANTDMYANFEYVGYEGRGLATYTQSASTNSVDLLYIGWGSTASGAYNLSGSGLLSVNEYAYVLPGGIFNQTGGTFAGILEVQGGIYNLSGTGGFGTAPNPQWSPTQINVISGIFNQTGGSLGSLVVSQYGGEIDGTLINTGGFVYNGGTFNARLVNKSVVSANADLYAYGGIENYSGLTIAAGRILFSGGSSQGIDNEGIINLNGGTLSFSSPVPGVNNGIISGNGAIEGLSPLVNNVSITQSGGNLILQGNSSLQNLGTISLAANYITQLAGSTALANSGVVNLNGSSVTGSGALTNAAGGSLIGPGTIASSFSNSGYIDVTGGAVNITHAFSNSGTIHLAGNGSSLLGGTVTNTGNIEGAGNLGSPVANTGTIEAIGGTLNLGGAITNSTGGLITAGSGNKLLVTQGLATNAGVIDLTGGTFDNNGHPLNNTGQISGYGTFRSSSLTNNGKITFTGGTTTINGDVINQSGKTIAVAYNPAIFTGNVTNYGTFKTTATTVTFASTFTENGIFISDPATQNFQDLVIGAAGALVGGVGDVFNVAGNLLNHSSQNSSWDTREAEIAFSGGGNHVLAWSGMDLGVGGYQQNFAIGTLRLSAGDSLFLQDGDAASGAAIYVGTLDLPGGLSQIASIIGNGVNIHYDSQLPGNSYLHGASYLLAGGGSITAVPEPGSIVLLCIGISLILDRTSGRRRGLVSGWDYVLIAAPGNRLCGIAAARRVSFLIRIVRSLCISLTETFQNKR